MCAIYTTKRGTPAFKIRVGSPSDIEALCEIDLDTSRLFKRAGLKLYLPEDHEFFLTERNRWIESLASSSALIAVGPDNRIMGFMASGSRDPEPYLDQLSVRRRVGSYWRLPERRRQEA